MNMSIESEGNGTECAFPVLEAEIGINFHPGLTKREHFAGLAMQGWLARCANVPHSAYVNPDDIAENAIEFADALLKKLEE